MTNTLDISVINHRRPLIKPRLSEVEASALEEAESFYSPAGILKLFTTYFRAGPGAFNHVGHGQFSDFDHSVSRILDVPGLATTFGSQVYGGGKGLDFYDMYVSSIGEGIERLLGSYAVFEWQDLIEVGSYKQMQRQGKTCLHPEELRIFSDRQFENPNFEFQKWDEDDVIGWLPGKRYFSGEQTYVPAQLVLFIYYRPNEEPAIGLAPSGGMASHISREKAQFHAITELFERDAINLRWHNEIPLEKIVLDCEFRDRKVQEAVESLGQQVNPPDFYLHNLDYPEFPVITAVSFDDWLDELAYNAGGGIGSNIDDAVRSSMGEYAQSERSLRICQLTRNWNFSGSFYSLFGIDPDADPSKFSRYIQAITYYGYEQNRERTMDYFDGGIERPLSDVYAQLDSFPSDPDERLRNMLNERSIDPVMFNFTLPGLKTIELWKAYIPELTLPYPPSSPALGHPRFLEIAKENGKDFETSADLLHEPVPYP